VYAASEGLRVVVLDCRRSAAKPEPARRIENYLGFPTGISGQALAGEPFVPSTKIRRRILIPAQVETLDCSKAKADGELQIKLTDGAGSDPGPSVVPSGARYRRPAVPGLKPVRGQGCLYWPPPSKRKCAPKTEVFWSAAEFSRAAAVFLASTPRRSSFWCAAPASPPACPRYRRPQSTPHPTSSFGPIPNWIDFNGDLQTGLTAVSWRNNRTNVAETAPRCACLLFVGADPETEWLEGCGIGLEANGFVVTG